LREPGIQGWGSFFCKTTPCKVESRRRRRRGRYLLFDTRYNWKCPMSIDAEVLNSEPVDLLCGMYATEYTSQSLARMRGRVEM